MLLARTPAPATADEAPSAPPSRRTLALVTAGTAILSIVVGLNEDIVTRLYATGALDVTSWPRLCYLAGLLLAGFLADIRKRAFMPVITLCVLMLSNMAIFFLSDPRHYQLNLSILYFYSGFYVVYFTVLFLDLAPGTRWPLLWAGMGRVISGLADCVLAAACIADLPLNIIIGIDVLMFIVLVISLAAGGYLLIGHKTEKLEHGMGSEGESALTPQQRLKRYAESCSLTPRETEVLEKLLTTEDGVQEIADSLFISRRMLQRYIASIYEKTETKTRIGLFQSYAGFGKKEK